MDILSQDIYDNDIFKSSNCIWYENSLMDFIGGTLQLLGYTKTDPSRKVWQRGERKVVVCLVDDITTCNAPDMAINPDANPQRRFDKNTIVITDNHIGFPTVYDVCQLPTSFFGIYYHEPEIQTWQPDRRLNFSVNRIDFRRLKLFLELQNRTYMLPDDLDLDNLDYINFNCVDRRFDNTTPQSRRANLQRIYFDDEFQKIATTMDRQMFEKFQSQIPYCNHNLSHEQAHVSAWLNVVIETYSSNNPIIALSEKTFRALSLPVPFTLYASKYALVYLQKIGFDVMPDIVPHYYDSMTEYNNGEFGDKIVDFIYESTSTVDKIQRNPPVQRCIDAAQHNRNLLKQMRQNWPTDFAVWWSETLKKIV